MTFDRHSGQSKFTAVTPSTARIGIVIVIVIVTGGEVAMAGERLKRVAAHLDSHDFCLIYGD